MAKHGKVKLPTDLFDIYIHHETNPTILTPNNDQYNGADISLGTDSTGNEYVAFTAKELSTGVFGFVIWDLTRWRKVSYAPFCNGRGEINNGGKWIAWNNKDFYKGLIAGFVPHPDLAGEIAVLRAQLAALQPGTALSARYINALERLCKMLEI